MAEVGDGSVRRGVAEQKCILGSPSRSRTTGPKDRPEPTDRASAGCANHSARRTHRPRGRRTLIPWSTTWRLRPIQLWYWRWRLKGREPEFCLGCGGPLETQTMALCRAAAGQVQLTLHGLPFAACGNGCRDRRLPLPGLLPRLEAALVDGGQVPIARTQTPSGSVSCHRCSSRSWRAGTRHAEVRGLVSLQGVSPFAATVAGPVQTCGSCGLQQLVPSAELRRDLALALARALRAAGIRTQFR